MSALRETIDLGVRKLRERLEALTAKEDPDGSKAAHLVATLDRLEANRNASDNARAAILMQLVVGRREFNKLSPFEKRQAMQVFFGETAPPALTEPTPDDKEKP